MLPGTITNRRRCATCVLAVFVGAMVACSGPSAEVARLQAEVESLRATQAQTASELARLKAQLQPGQEPGVEGGAVRTLTVAGRPARGPEAAKVTFIEYSDYGCPFCAQYTRDVYPRLVRDYVDTGRVRYVFKNYPVEALHPGAFKAHVAAACGGDQGRYWQMHDQLFASQAPFTTDRLTDDARRAGLDAATFGACLAGTAHDALIRQDIDEAVRGGVSGTPVFVVAMTAPGGGAVTPLRVIVGVQPFEAYSTALDAVLASGVTARPHP